MEHNKLFLAKPHNEKLYHVYGGDNRSLCGRSAILFPNPDLCENVTGKESWLNGQDCKNCFRKAGLKI